MPAGKPSFDRQTCFVTFGSPRGICPSAVTTLYLAENPKG